MHGDRRAPSDRHHAVPEYLGAYGARHPPVHFAGDLLLHVLPQGAVTVILLLCQTPMVQIHFRRIARLSQDISKFISCY